MFTVCNVHGDQSFKNQKFFVTYMYGDSAFSQIQSIPPDGIKPVANPSLFIWNHYSLAFDIMNIRNLHWDNGTRAHLFAEYYHNTHIIWIIQILFLYYFQVLKFELSTYLQVAQNTHYTEKQHKRRTCENVVLTILYILWITSMRY